MRQSLTAVLSVLGLVVGFAPAQAADLEWEVENPFRFYKVGSSFALHEKAFDAVRGAAESPIPADIVWRTERRLNDPDCKDKSTPAACARTAGRNTTHPAWAGLPAPALPPVTTTRAVRAAT
jgi:hypothetical protein